MDGEHILNNHISPDEQKWEHPWTTDEIRRNSANWTLAGDVGLFHLLNEFSHKLISRTHEVENEVDALVHKTKIASVKINNVINDFHMLSNLQFVENRVYDEEIQDNSAQEKSVQEKTKEQREAEMLPKVIQAIELGLSVLEQAFDKINVEEISDSEDEEDLSSEGRTILEPKDPYENRSLPFIIGSKEFENDDFAGLRELCEEEAADVSVEDQTVSESESESSSSEEEEPLPLIDSTDSKFSGRTEDRMVAESISDKLSSSDESELFGSEKGDENEIFSELSLDAKKNQVNQALKANLENIERKDTRHSSISSMQSRLKLPQVLPSPKKEENFKEEKDLFSNEDEVSDDDDSPFQKKSSLFKSEAKFANDDQDALGDDIFGEKSKVQDVISPPPKLEKPITQKETKTQSSAKNPRDSILFGTDDSEDDMFSTLTKAKPLVKAKAPEKSVKAHKATSQPVKKAEKPFGFKENGSNSLFGDDSDADDLFAETKSQKKFGFESTEDDDLFGLINEKTPKVSKEKENILPSKSAKSDKEFSLFDDSGSFDQTEKFETKKPQTVTTTGKVPKLFDDSDGSEQETKERKTRAASITKPKKNNVLFSDSEGEIFKQEPSKTKSKPVIVDDDFSLFDDNKTVVVQQNTSVKGKSKEPASLFEDSDNFDLFREKSTVKKDMPSNKAIAPKQANIDTPDALFFDDSSSRAAQDAKINSLKTEVPPLKQTKDASPTVDLFDDSLPVSSKSEVPLLKQRKAASPTVDLFDDSLPVSSKSEITSNVESSNNGGSTEISFDSPADISNTLNILGKDRIKVSAKRRKPTRKGRLAALQTNDSNETNSELKDPPITNIEQIMQSTTMENAPFPIKTTVTHKEKEKQKKNLMSQLISEVATSKVRRIPVPTKENNDDDDDEVDLFATKPRAKTSSQSIAVPTKEDNNDDDEVDLFATKPRAKTSSQSEFSFLSPVENSLSSTKMSLDTPEQNSEDKSEAASALSTENTENVDNEDFFAEPSFKGFRSSISHQNSVIDFDDDDDDDDLFKSIKDPLPKLKSTPAVTNSDDIFSDDADDIFAGLQKEKYEMFPSQLYEEDGDEGDIFGSSEKPPVNKTITSNASTKTNSSTLKKEPEKKPVDLFEDPLTGLLQE